MKVMKKLLGSVLLSLGFLAGTAHAGLIVNTVEQHEYVGFWESYDYEHNLNDDGFVLGSALGGTLEINISNGNLWNSILFVVDDFDGDTGGTSWLGNGYDSELEVGALASINSDGYLGVTVKSLFGSFWLGDSVLSVETAQVPGPGIVGLMGIGLLGLGLARRRRSGDKPVS